MIMNKVKTTVENFFYWYTGNEFLHPDFGYHVMEFITPDLVEEFGCDEESASFRLAEVLKYIKDDEIEVEVGKETGDASESYYAKFTIGDGVQLDKFDLCIYTKKPFTVND